VQLLEGVQVRLSLQETNTGIQLGRHGKVLVIGDPGPNEGRVVRSDLRYIGVESVAESSVAVAS
jgi:hypothetical protein